MTRNDLNKFWQENRTTIIIVAIGLCALLLLAI